MRKTKPVYQTSKGIYIGETVAYESPLEPGVFLIPAGCVETPPPLINDDSVARWNGSTWEVESLPKKAEPTPEEIAALEKAQAVATARSYLYQTDWYIIRKIERGIDIPADVAAKRLESVDFINSNE